jgi:ABC-type transport system involved in multi-copper enzyme maturation permease subunit
MRSPVWAIVADTWRQSRQQIVYLLLAFALLVVSLGAVLLVKVCPSAEGPSVLALRWADHPRFGLERAWDLTYRGVLAGDRIAEATREPDRKAEQANLELLEAEQRVARARIDQAPAAEQKVLEGRLGEARARAEQTAKELERVEQEVSASAQALVAQRAPSMTPVAKGVEVWISSVTSVIFLVVMLGFVAAAAGYFPGLMKAGAIDLVLAKPISRVEIFFGKFLGGLGLCAVALGASELVLLVGLRVVTGEWAWGVFGAAPVTLFATALLYALVAVIGIITRSTILSLLGGYAYYLVVDTVIQVLMRLDNSGLKIGWLDQAARVSRWAFPAFERLRGAAAAAVLHIPIFEWQPILVGVGWLAGLLGLGYLVFRRTDF